MNLQFVDVDPQGDVALVLLRDAAIDVQQLYVGNTGASLSLPTNAPLGARDVYTAAWLGDVPVACGAIRELDQSTAEVQRVYVHRHYRRRSYGRMLLLHLEHRAKALRYTRWLLETGDRQGPAKALYETFGFSRVQPYGMHVDDPTSLCYERHL